jgi:hypothetical protein
VQLEHKGTSAGGTHDEIRAAETRLRQATGLIEETGTAWERVLERNGFGVQNGYLAASARLMDEWGRDPSAVVPTEKIIRESILQTIQQLVKTLHDSLEALAVRLRDDLKSSAMCLGITVIPREEEFQSLVRGTPIFDPGSLNASTVRPRLSALFGRRFAEKRLARQLHQELGGALDKALGTYSEVLREWTRLVINQLSRRFETYAEGYRAQAERMAVGRGLVPEYAHGLRQDIRLLEASKSESVDAEVQKQFESEETPLFSGETMQHARKGESN